MTAGAPPGFNRDDWKAPATLAWALEHTAAFLPTRPIRASLEAAPLPEGEAWEIPGWSEFLRDTHADAALVLHRGAIVARHGDTARPRMLFSITKSIVGLAALALVERGLLNPTRAVRDYVPAFSATPFGGAAVGDLLAMRDGVRFDETYGDRNADIHSYSRHYWGGAPGGTWAAILSLADKGGEPGGFAYRTPVADVVGWVLRAAASADLTRIVEDLVWHPVGAGDPAHFVLDTAGAEIAGAGLNASAQDLARIANALLGRGRPFLGQATLDGLFSGGDPAAFRTAGYADRPGWSYRDLFWHCGGGTVAALGVHGQRLSIDRTRELLFLRLGSAPLPDNRPGDARHAEMLDRLAAQTDVSIARP